MAKINFQDKFSKFSELWTPKVIAENEEIVEVDIAVPVKISANTKP